MSILYENKIIFFRLVFKIKVHEKLLIIATIL